MHAVISAVLARALAVNPADRYDTATAFLDALERAATSRPWLPTPVAIALVVIIAVIAGVAGYAGYRELTDWPDARDDIVAAFPELLPERPDQTVTWELTGKPEPYDCSPSTWRGQRAIECRRRDDTGVRLTAIGFDSQQDRAQGVDSRLRELPGWNRGLVFAEIPPAECRVQALRDKSGQIPLTFVFPETPRSRILLTLAGPDSHEGWKKLPLC